MKEKYYDDPKENAAFLRHVDVVTNMILKYGPALKRKWAREALFNTVWLGLVIYALRLIILLILQS